MGALLLIFFLVGTVLSPPLVAGVIAFDRCLAKKRLGLFFLASIGAFVASMIPSVIGAIVARQQSADPTRIFIGSFIGTGIGMYLGGAVMYAVLRHVGPKPLKFPMPAKKPIAHA